MILHPVSGRHHQYIYLKHQELNELYLSVFIKSLGDSLISIFTPIFFFSIGYSISKIALFNIIGYLSISIFLPLGIWLDQKIGIKKTLSIGLIFIMLYYLALTKLRTDVPFFLLAVFWGLSIALYYGAFNVELSRVLKIKTAGKSFSLFQILSILAGIVGPIIGALIINYRSYNSLFILVGIFYLFAILPLFKTKDYKLEKQTISLKSLAKIDTKRKAINYQILGAIGVISAILWPIFIYSNHRNILTLGTIISLTSLILILFIFLEGKLVDTNHAKTFKYGIISHSPTWIIRLFLISPFGLAFSNLASSATYELIDLSFSKSVWKKASKIHNIGEYFIFREANLDIGRIICLSFLFFGLSSVSVFIGASILTLLQIFNIKVIE